MSDLRMTPPASYEERRRLPIPDRAAPVNTGIHREDGQAVGLGSSARDHAGPNVVIVLIDDMGFGASSTYGGPCAMPTADRLAADGLRYSRFHTTALCSPTRQSLMTGRNHHAVNMANITNLASDMPGYTSVRPNTAATLAEVLRHNGYATGAFGKMHQTPGWETSAAGPFDRWPTGEGFEKFYGFLHGETDQWNPILYDGTVPVDRPDDPDYHLSEDLTDRAIDWVRMRTTFTPDRPFFLYLSYGATHAPHHAPRSWIEKYRGRFDEGWDAEREAILARQKELGVVPEAAELTRRHDEIPAWADLDDTERMVAVRLMEAYAGMAEHTDHQVGRLVDALEETGQLDDTLFLYILGDNGASAEGGDHGTINEIASLNGVHHEFSDVLARVDEIGTEHSYNHYPAGWAHAMNTPYQWTKQVASHWGGTRVGMVAHWPRGIDGAGEVRDDWRHVIDIYPTILESLGLPIPESVNGVDQQPVDGASFAETFTRDTQRESGVVQYFEMFGNRGIYADGWSACTKHMTPWHRTPDRGLEDDLWELYGPGDWTQAHDLAAEHPEKLEELRQLFEHEAIRNHVYPIDDRRGARFLPDVAGRPDVTRGRTAMRLYRSMTRMPDGVVPSVQNKSFTLDVAVDFDPATDEGVLFSEGGRFAGWVVYVRDSTLHYAHNWLGTELYVVSSTSVPTAGEHTFSVAFTVDGGEDFGRGGTIVLSVDGSEVGRGHIEKTVPFIYGGTTDVGCDHGSGVISGYGQPQGKYTGVLRHVDIETFTDDDHRPVPPEVRQQIEETQQ